MAQERLAVRKLREVLRLRFASKLSTRNIATSLGIGNGTVCEYLGRARVAGVCDWPLPPELDDDTALSALLFPAEGKGVAHRPEPDWAQVHRELKRKGVTKLLEAVRPLLEKLNNRPMRHVGRSRRQLYEELEKPVLKALPVHAYELAFWKKARVHPDYHVEVEGHLYSVPYSLAHKQVEARYTEGSIEVFLGGRRVASHVRKHAKGYTTLKEHMPASHRAHAEWTPARLLTWAEKTGPSTAALVQGLMERKPHPEQGFRGALGVMRLKDKYGEARLEKACARAVRHRAYSYKSVAAILQHHLEDAREEREEKPPLPAHENVRGPHYYH